MLDNMFMAMARRKNRHAPMLCKLNAKLKLDEPLLRKATVEILDNGDRVVDLDVIQAARLKRQAIWYVVTIAAGAVASELGRATVRR